MWNGMWHVARCLWCELLQSKIGCTTRPTRPAPKDKRQRCRLRTLQQQQLLLQQQQQQHQQLLLLLLAAHQNFWCSTFFFFCLSIFIFCFHLSFIQDIQHSFWLFRVCFCCCCCYFGCCCIFCSQVAEFIPLWFQFQLSAHPCPSAYCVWLVKI